jgi:2-amino-4-hydroxy-6-hydroxymethyldihydropteridine diphosphokinase
MGTNMPFDGMAEADLLRAALADLVARGVKLKACSSVWRTEAWPVGADQPDYYNAVVELDRAGLEPQPLYEKLATIERSFGRDRREKWASRTLDLDIVAMEGFVGLFDHVELPHPRMQDRAFVLAPLAEIAPDWRHPALGAGAAAMLAVLPGGYRYRRVGELSA